MSKVRFKDWLFEADVDRTRRVFENTQYGGSDECVCDNCANYCAQRATVFPIEIKDLFENLGIDYRKECETYTTHKLENGNINYHGWFHFAGNMLEGISSKRQISETGYTLDLVQVGENFEIGFTDERDLTYFDKTYPVVQVEFAIGLPWVIDAPELED